MSTASDHMEWLSLVEVSGPFISLNVLLEAFPQGLDDHDPEHMRNLKTAYSEWQSSQESNKPSFPIHRAWVSFVLRETLGFPDQVLLSGQKIPQTIYASFPEHSEILRPDWVVAESTNVDSVKPRLLVQIFPSNQHLEKRLIGSKWSASPASRMMELLHSTNVRLGLISNGHQWMLVNAPRGETTGFISWYTNLWVEENITLRAFRSLLSSYRFFSVANDKTLESLLSQSVNDQQDVTDQLGYQVRKAVEVLVQKFDRIDKDCIFPLKEIEEKELYKAALTVMMRLVVLFCAEEKELFPLNDEFYSNYYAVSTLREKLREIADQHGEEILGYHHDAWARLLAISRAVHFGVYHSSFSLPAYGGSLFDPDKFPFLEGRPNSSSWKNTPAKSLPVDNRTVLHLLESLQILQVRLPGGGGSEPRRLSFRALDVEQIGHVYEGLLDHTAVRATSVVLGLEGTKDKEPEILLSDLEKFQQKGENELLSFLNTQTGRTTSALKKALNLEISEKDEEKFLLACDSDYSLWQRLKPFVGLVRKDKVDYPVIISTGSVYVTQGQDRRSTGTHYTPRSLTEPIVQYTLEPICYVGVAEGKPKEEWQLKTASELLKIKVCDFAMGSGAFLVQACRYLAERLVEAWDQGEPLNSGQLLISPEGEPSEANPSESIIPKDTEERLLLAKRIIVDRCIYGVDINPMAVEMAKLSLWLVTMQKDRPFTFLDHALKCGDSLLGVTDAKQIEYFSLQPDKKKQSESIEEICKPLLETAIAKRKELEGFTAIDIQGIRRKEELFLQAEKALEQVRFLGDLLIGEALKNISKSGDMTAIELGEVFRDVTHAFSDVSDPYHNTEIQSLRDQAKRLLGSRTPFHWLLEFPEIFWTESDSKGFDALVGNPPFQGGSKITGVLGTDYRDFLVEQIANGKRGTADLSAYFFLRAEKLLLRNGGFGLLATNTIAQGDTREVGLEQLVANGCVISRAVPSCKWPGTASLEVSHIWLRKGKWNNEFILNEISVTGITSFLSMPNKVIGTPYRLITNIDKAFKGSEVYGRGFILKPEEAQILIEKDSNNKNILFPYLDGEDLNSSPNQSSNRWVINFKDLPLDKYTAPKDYTGYTASDYPICLQILRERVKPERDLLAIGDASARDRARRWWQFARPTIALYNTLARTDKILATARVSPSNAVTWLDTGTIFNEKIVIFPIGQNYFFSIIQSSHHWEWARLYTSTLGGKTLNYSISDCLETFPFPISYESLDEIGERYYNYRQSIMLTRQEGLTKTYNRFHKSNETSPDIAKLRELHKEMDEAVANAYGWSDLDLGHGFHQTKQGIRYTISEEARREVLDRLLELNHERYAEEVAAGLHDIGKGKKKETGVSKSKASKAKAEEAEEVQGSLF